MIQTYISNNGIGAEVVKVFVNNGADSELANNLAELVYPMRFASPRGKFKDRISQAYMGMDYQYLAFARLLVGKTDDALALFHKAIDHCNHHPSGYMASEIEKVQEIVTLSIPHLPYIASDDTLF